MPEICCSQYSCTTDVVHLQTQPQTLLKQLYGKKQPKMPFIVHDQRTQTANSHKKLSVLVDGNVPLSNSRGGSFFLYTNKTSESFGMLSNHYRTGVRHKGSNAMGELKYYKPTTPGFRGRITIKRDGLWKGRPYAPLVTGKGMNKSGGRNNTGRITVWHKGGGHKRLYRKIDFARAEQGEDSAEVIRIEYDPNRSARIALIQAEGRKPSYMIAPEVHFLKTCPHKVDMSIIGCVDS